MSRAAAAGGGRAAAAGGEASAAAEAEGAGAGEGGRDGAGLPAGGMASAAAEGEGVTARAGPPPAGAAVDPAPSSPNRGAKPQLSRASKQPQEKRKFFFFHAVSRVSACLFQSLSCACGARAPRWKMFRISTPKILCNLKEFEVAPAISTRDACQDGQLFLFLRIAE